MWRAFDFRRPLTLKRNISVYNALIYVLTDVINRLSIVLYFYMFFLIINCLLKSMYRVEKEVLIFLTY